MLRWHRKSKNFTEPRRVTVVNVSHVIFKETKDKYNKVFTVKNKAII